MSKGFLETVYEQACIFGLLSDICRALKIGDAVYDCPHTFLAFSFLARGVLASSDDISSREEKIATMDVRGEIPFAAMKKFIDLVECVGIHIYILEKHLQNASTMLAIKMTDRTMLIAVYKNDQDNLIFQSQSDLLKELYPVIEEHCKGLEKTVMCQRDKIEELMKEEIIGGKDLKRLERNKVKHERDKVELLKELDKLKGKSEEIREKIGKLTRDNVRLEGLQNRLKSSTRERLEAQEELSGVQKELQGVKNELQGFKNELQGVKNELQRVKNESQGIKNESQRVKNESQRVKNELQGLDNELKRLKSCMSSTQKFVSQGKEELSRVNDEFTRVNDELTRVNEDVSRVNDELTRVSDVLTRVSDVLTRVNEDVSRVNDELTKSQYKCMRIVQEKNSEDVRIAYFEKKLLELIEEKISLVQVMNGLHIECAKIRSDIDFANAEKFVKMSLY